MKYREVETPSLKGGRLPISVELLVQWTYAIQKADVMMMPMASAPASVESQLEQILALGTRVDTSGVGANMAFHDGDHVAPDAAVVHETVRLYLPREQRDLVMMHGRLRTQPDPRIGARHRLEPVWRLVEREDGVMLRVAEPAYLDRRQAWYVPIRQIDRPSEVAHDRKQYELWREGLATVLAVAGPQLTRHELSDAFPPASPWLVDEGVGPGA